jgi:hypothetical protein
MEPWIVAAKRQIASIVANTQAEHPNTTFHVAFVGYRDFGDEEPFVVVPFTSNITAFLSQIDNVHADGGGDIAEDVAGGFVKVLSLNWQDTDVRSIVHIADAPGHGSNLHATYISDRHPRNDFGILDSVRALIATGIDYTFIRADRDTDIMTDLFSTEYSTFPERTFTLLDLSGQSSPIANQLYREEAVFVNDTMFSSEVTRTVSRAVSRHTASQYQEEY